MREIILMTKNRAEEFSLGQTDASTTENGTTENSMEEELTQPPTEPKEKVFGEKANVSDGSTKKVPNN